jgi:catechol 2,3-dioxygenase-like lactoylglutathione lyase family enzyme
MSELKLRPPKQGAAMAEGNDLLVMRESARLGRRPLHRLGVTAIVLGMICVQVASASNEPKRPRILSIQGVDILSSGDPTANEFYRKLRVVIGDCYQCENIPTEFIPLSSGQTIHISHMPSTQPSNFLVSISFEIGDEESMKQFLEAKGVPFIEHAPKYKEARPYLSVVDPAGNLIFLVGPTFWRIKRQSSIRLIHAGFVVKDRGAMDHFYRDILGFRLYWSGGMKDGETDWVAMQVPDGTDWIEYMLNVNPKADKQELGVMNHISLGVVSVKAAAEQLEKAGVKLPEPPQMGRDGKWQLNLYDPDWTRVELMEFTPVEKPCCSEFTGPHPKP